MVEQRNVSCKKCKAQYNIAILLDYSYLYSSLI